MHQIIQMTFSNYANLIIVCLKYFVAKEGTERPHILEKPQSVIVNEGEMVRLEVFAVGRPTPEIVWLKDNSILIPDKNPDIRFV